MRKSSEAAKLAAGEGRLKEIDTPESYFRNAVRWASRVKTNLLEWETVMEISRNLVLPEDITMTNGARQVN